MWIDSRGAQFGVEQQARARAALTIDKSNAAPGQVAHTAQVFGIAARNNQTVLAEGEIDEDDVLFRQEMLDEGRVVFAGLHIQQVNAGDICRVLRKREQSANAADCTRGCARELREPCEKRVIAAGDNGMRRQSRRGNAARGGGDGLKQIERGEGCLGFAQCRVREDEATGVAGIPRLLMRVRARRVFTFKRATLQFELRHGLAGIRRVAERLKLDGAKPIAIRLLEPGAPPPDR